MSTLPDYKSTIRLPQTDFPMKGDLPQREPTQIKKWDEQNLYKKIQTQNKGKKTFTLPDGPPYANGSIHVGHVLNKVLKDIVIKYKNMSGYSAAFIPGWDCHGLPIEHKVMKDLKEKAREKSDHDIRGLCREEAQKWVNTQREQFRRLGVLADWENPYLTMQPEYEAEEVREFARAYNNKTVYRGVKPVYWNWTLQTALADAEVEYHQHKSPSIYVKFPVIDASTRQKLGVTDSAKSVSFVIWTTTPWTLPANLGISLNADFEYALFSQSDSNEILVFAKDLKEAVEKDTGLALSVVSTVSGTALEHGKARHPFYDRDSVIMLGNHVTLDAGTGCVHTAPGHGMEDYQVGLRYGLPIYSPVNEAGQYTADVADYAGMNIFKTNPLIVERLRESGKLLAFKEIEHSYPHCWRSKTPLFFRATPQWFIGMDIESSEETIRQKALSAISKIQFVPEWGVSRLTSMMQNRPDWCLSRQRTWGVPIPIFYCIATGEPLADVDLMMKVADEIEHNGGIDAFYKIDTTSFLAPFTSAEQLKKHSSNPDYGTKGFKVGRDILDVWFDSGICHSAVQKRREGMSFPADIYLEGSDQHRGWFNTSLLSSLATNGEAPFKALLTHGFVVDSQGRKMSKSLGNVVDPQDVTSKSGAEILRLWVAYEDYGQDVSCGKTELDRVTETYRRIRNTMRFLLGATADFDPARDTVAYDKMTELDQWALNELATLIEKTQKAYDTYEFNKVYHALNQFFTVTLSATYLDILKDRLYTWKPDGVDRRASQTVIYHMTKSLLTMMAPILSFLADEGWGYLKGEKAESVFLAEFPTAPSQWKRPELAQKFELLLSVRGETQKALENLRAQKIIGASLEAKVLIKAAPNTLAALNSFAGLREFLIVSDVQVADLNTTISLSSAQPVVEMKQEQFVVMATQADGEKCVRCWTYSTQTNASTQFPQVCPKCVEALS